MSEESLQRLQHKIFVTPKHQRLRKEDSSSTYCTKKERIVANLIIISFLGTRHNLFDVWRLQKESFLLAFNEAGKYDTLKWKKTCTCSRKKGRIVEDTISSYILENGHCTHAFGVHEDWIQQNVKRVKIANSKFTPKFALH